MNKNASIVCFGDNCVDLYDFPVKRRYAGGNAVNTAVHARETGCSVSYVGILGNDENGEAILRKLKEKGIDVSQVQTCSSDTAWTKVRLAGGEREFVEEYLGPTDQLQITDDLLRYLSKHRILHNTWQGGTEKYLKCFRETCKDTLITFDFGERYSEDFLKRCISYTDIAFFSMNPEEGERAGKFAAKIHLMGPEVVVVTMGKNGAILSQKGKEWIRVDAKVIDAVDTLGAGDTFIGSFLGNFALNRPFSECMQAAAEAAAANCMITGGFRNSLIEMPEVLA